jgi:hypothetical protein
VDPTAVTTAGMTMRFSGMAMMAERCGPHGDDVREDGTVLENGGDGQAAWNQWR